MHCPQCGQQQISDETRFCSRCGFLLTGIAEVVANQGVVPAPKGGFAGEPGSPRRLGIKKGGFLFLLVFLLGPLMAIIISSLHFDPSIIGITVVLCVGGGLLRTAYALMFESGVSGGAVTAPTSITPSEQRLAIPPSQSVQAAAYASPAGSWRDTNDLQRQSRSATDRRTNLLQEKDQ